MCKGCCNFPADDDDDVTRRMTCTNELEDDGNGETNGCDSDYCPL